MTGHVAALAGAGLLPARDLAVPVLIDRTPVVLAQPCGRRLASIVGLRLEDRR